MQVKVQQCNTSACTMQPNRDCTINSLLVSEYGNFNKTISIFSN